MQDHLVVGRAPDRLTHQRALVYRLARLQVASAPFSWLSSIAYVIIASMRSVLIIGLVLLVAIMSPLSVVLTPFLSFHQYARRLPVVSSHSHIQNSLTSVRDAGLVSLCLSPTLSHLPSICSWQANATPDIHATLANLALIQGKMGEQLAQYHFTNSFNSALSVQRATDLALAFDDLALLFGDSDLESHGISHVQLLVEVNRASRSLWAALYRVILHVELGLGRLAYIDKIVLAGMKHFIGSDDRHQIVPVPPLLLSRLANISVSATFDSIHHVQVEIATAEDSFSVLLEALRRFAMNTRAHRQCSLPRVKDVCADIAILWRGDEHIQIVRNELARVSQILDVASHGLFTLGISTSAALPPVSAAVGIDARKLEQIKRKLLRCSWFARQARNFAGVVLEAARA